MRTTPRCRKCGESIGFAHRPGFVIAGQPKYIAVNADDRQPHGKRCRLILGLREAKRSGSSPIRGNPKGSLTAKRAEALTPTEGVQLDAFDTA